MPFIQFNHSRWCTFKVPVLMLTLKGDQSWVKTAKGILARMRHTQITRVLDWLGLWLIKRNSNAVEEKGLQEVQESFPTGGQRKQVHNHGAKETECVTLTCLQICMFTPKEEGTWMPTGPSSWRALPLSTWQQGAWARPFWVFGWRWPTVTFFGSLTSTLVTDPFYSTWKSSTINKPSVRYFPL
jgi:hypothetical protein